MTVGSASAPRHITPILERGTFYSHHEAADFIITIRKISLYSRKWASSVFVPLLPGHAFTLWVMKKRYGFIYVDRDNAGHGTMKRHKKDSFYWYKKVIATNSEDL